MDDTFRCIAYVLLREYFGQRLITGHDSLQNCLVFIPNQLPVYAGA